VMVTHDNDLAGRVTRALHVADGEIVEDRKRWLEAELAEESRGAVTSGPVYHRKG